MQILSKNRNWRKLFVRVILLLFASALQSFWLDSSASPGKTQQAPAADRFENDIRAFEEKDKLSPPPANGTVFVGSSTFTRWNELEKTFSSFSAINRGFGGSTFPDINHYVDRIVTAYKPKKVVVYAGSNDIAELKHSGEEVFSDFKKFVGLVRKKLPGTDIYVISLSVAPCRLEWSKNFDTANRLIAKYVKSSSQLHYIDVIPVMRDTTGKLKNDLFGPDRLHMNENGYALWTTVIERELGTKSRG